MDPMPRHISASESASTGAAYAIPKAAPHWRVLRLRRAAWLLDRSIPLGRYRIGLDPLIGLIPGAGDWIGALLSLYFIYEAARLGLPVKVLARMGANVAVESILGLVPLIGDLFDFVWQANVRNLRLVEQHYRPALPPRSLRNVWLAITVFSVLLLALIGAAVYRLIRFVFSWF
ncbi:MAG: DUF4112 domain-containing protein [Opitutaceae bacterium]